MSFEKYKDLIEEGDTVIIYINFNVMHSLVVSPTRINKSGESIENIFQTTYGALKVQQLIGMKYGAKVQLSRGYAYALYPTPELWTKTLPHRTQILYATDISMIITQLELRPGSVVVESGTGSGSLSHSLVRTIAPDGHLHTFDFHEKRVEAAKDEFQTHGIDKMVTAQQRDVCQDGFGLENIADAVFLDLPHPWDAIPHAKKALKKSGGRICSFSPCIEQVQKACSALQSEGFIEISTLECLLREFQVRRISMPVYDENRQMSDENPANRKRKLDDDDDNSVDRENNDQDNTTNNGLKKNEESCFVTGIPLINMPGHTGYLTFATLPKL